MLNIKDNGFGRPKTYASILNYDRHGYKEERLVMKNEQDENVRLVDNRDIFEKLKNQYNQDLFDSYSKERHKKLKKTHEEKIKSYLDSKIMRSFRISINHIELEALHSPNDSEAKKKQNIIDFYKNTLDTFVDVLNQNNQFNQKVLVVQADIHFDQASPHLHVHISNLYERYSKKLQRNIISNNIKISDCINFLMTEKQKTFSNDSINQIFTDKLKAKVNNERYNLVNKIDLKALFPHLYNLNLWKISHGYDDINRFWRHDKELYFKMVRENLQKWNFNEYKNEKNEILLSRKIDEISLYCFKQAIYMDVNKALKPGKSVEDQIKSSIQNPHLFSDKISKMKILEPLELKKFDYLLCDNLANFTPNLEKTEKELIKNLNLFEYKQELQKWNNQFHDTNSNELLAIYDRETKEIISQGQDDSLANNEKINKIITQINYERDILENWISNDLIIDDQLTRAFENLMEEKKDEYLEQLNQEREILKKSSISELSLKEELTKSYDKPMGENKDKQYLNNKNQSFINNNINNNETNITSKYEKMKKANIFVSKLDSLRVRRSINNYKAPIINDNNFKPYDLEKTRKSLNQIDNEKTNENDNDYTLKI